jgi:hypothetical protein
VTANQLCVLFLAILLHELAHRILVWWSEGLCETPEHNPFFEEAGRFIEREFFGGVCEALWKPGKGAFRYLLGLALQPLDGGLRLLGMFFAFSPSMKLKVHPRSSGSITDTAKFQDVPCSPPSGGGFFTPQRQSWMPSSFKSDLDA